MATSERSPAELRSPAVAADAKQRVERYLGVLESQLCTSPFVLGKRYQLVDLIVANTVQYGAVSGVPPKSFPKVAAWLEGCMARPSMRGQWGG
jgi:glutathione S-transferase